MLNFWLSENCQKIFLSESFYPKMQNLRLKTTIFKTFGGKIKIFPISEVCWTFAADCWKIATSCPVHFFYFLTLLGIKPSPCSYSSKFPIVPLSFSSFPFCFHSFFFSLSVVFSVSSLGLSNKSELGICVLFRWSQNQSPIHLRFLDILDLKNAFGCKVTVDK